MVDCSILGCLVQTEPLNEPGDLMGFNLMTFPPRVPSSGLKTKRCLTSLPENPELTQPSSVPWSQTVWLLIAADCHWLSHPEPHSPSHRGRQSKHTQTCTVTHQHSGISYMHEHEHFLLKKRLFDPNEKPFEQTFTCGFNLPSMTASVEQFSPFSFRHPALEKNSPTMLAPCSVWTETIGPHFTFERHTFFQLNHF